MEPTALTEPDAKQQYYHVTKRTVSSKKAGVIEELILTMPYLICDLKSDPIRLNCHDFNRIASLNEHSAKGYPTIVFYWDGHIHDSKEGESTEFLPEECYLADTFDLDLNAAQLVGP